MLTLPILWRCSLIFRTKTDRVTGVQVPLGAIFRRTDAQSRTLLHSYCTYQRDAHSGLHHSHIRQPAMTRAYPICHGGLRLVQQRVLHVSRIRFFVHVTLVAHAERFLGSTAKNCTDDYSLEHTFLRLPLADTGTDSSR